MSDLISVAAGGGVLRVTVQRAEKRNALSRPTLAALGDTFTAWRDRDDLSVAVLTGAGDKAFASGGDLRELQTVRTAADARAFSDGTRDALDAIRRFPVPVIAALNGDALGGGAELALACDVRVAAPHARIGFLQGTLAISTAWGGGADLFRLLGSARALTLLCGAEVLPAARALELGLLDAVGPAEALEAFVARFAARRPQVARAFKALAIAHRESASAAEMASVETDGLVRTWCHDDHWAAADAVLNRIGRTG